MNTAVVSPASGPLPRLGTKLMKSFMGRYQNAIGQAFGEDDALVTASWWARIHGLPAANISQSSNGRWIVWAP